MPTQQKSNIFDVITNMIEEGYNNSQNDIGWRFLVTSKKTLMSNSGIFLITTNPGGNEDNNDHPRGSCENGCAYISESWKNKPAGESPLQKQFISLFEELARRHTNKDKIDLMESSVCGYFIPFRSPDYESLKDEKESISLAKRIWEMILRLNFPKLIICIDKETHQRVSKIIKNLNYNLISTKQYSIEWEPAKAEVAKYMKDGNGLSIIKFPHFSRYKIFSRKTQKEESKKAIDLILDDATKNLFEEINNEPSERHVELLIEKTGKECGFKPSEQQAKDYIAKKTQSVESQSLPAISSNSKKAQQGVTLTGRLYWEDKATRDTVEICDDILELALSGCTLNFNNENDIPLIMKNGRKFAMCKPIKSLCKLGIYQSKNELFESQLFEAGLREEEEKKEGWHYVENKYKSFYYIYLYRNSHKNDIKKYSDFLTKILKAAYNNASK